MAGTLDVSHSLCLSSVGDLLALSDVEQLKLATRDQLFFLSGVQLASGDSSLGGDLSLSQLAKKKQVLLFNNNISNIHI